MGQMTMSIADYDGEVSTATFPGSDLTAANIDAENTEITALRAAVNAVVLGKELKYSVMARTSPQAVGRATNALAQRESKALVRYYDAITFARGTLEIPTPDLSTQNADYPGVFYLDGAANNNADWEAFVTAFEAYVPGPGGNAAVVEEIVHVGRNI